MNSGGQKSILGIKWGVKNELPARGCGKSEGLCFIEVRYLTLTH